MAATSRGEMIPEGSQFVHGGANAHRGHTSGGLGSERSGFLRDSHEFHMQIVGGSNAGRGVPAGSTVSTHTELSPLSQVLVLETIPFGEQYFARQLELRRVTNAAFGSCIDDPSLGNVLPKSLELSGIEELKRIRASISDNMSRARERSRHLMEAISKLDKYFNVIQARKRSRSDSSATPAECPTAAQTKVSLSSPLGPVDGTRLVDKPKSLNKRLRTSVADVRVENRVNSPALPRLVSFSEKGKDSGKPKGPVSYPVEGKSRSSSFSADVWEKLKLKGRRSGIKQDISVTNVPAGMSEGEREYKWSGKHRLSQDSRARPHEVHGLRSGPIRGITSIHKAESALHLNGLELKSVSKGESDYVASNADRTERSLAVDKERSLSKSVCKPAMEAHSLSSAVITKVKAARAPRSNSVALGNFTHLGRISSTGDHEKLSAASKIQVISGQTTRKRPAPSRSSSPPMTQWGGQRPQKIARVPRRVNIMPPVGLLDDTDATDNLSDGYAHRDSSIVGARSNSGNVGGSGPTVKLQSSGMASPIQSRPRSGRADSSFLASESEESEGATNSRFKERSKKHGIQEIKQPLTVQTSDGVSPAKDLQAEVKEVVGDSIKRQGRSGRTTGTPKPLHVMMRIEEIDVSGTAKQLRSTKRGTEKPERSGRAIIKNRTFDRKSLTRVGRPSTNGSGELSDELDDDRDELINAAKATINASALACSSDFWKNVEPYFAYLTADDMSFLQNQVGLKCTSTSSSLSSMKAPGKPLFLANDSSVYEGEFDTDASKSTSREDFHGGRMPKATGFWLAKVFPLSQRLLAALISEGEAQENSRQLEGDFKCKNLGIASENSQMVANYGESVKDESALTNRLGIYACTDLLLANSVAGTDDILLHKKQELPYRLDKYNADNYCDSYEQTDSPSKQDGIRKSGRTACQLQYEAMSLDDRIVLELQSIGIAVEQVPDLTQSEQEDIDVEVSKLEKELNNQACSNKQRIQALEQAILSQKEAEERVREALAMTKLVEIAYQKRKGYRGGAPSSTGSKSSGPRVTRVAAMAFAKRTLTRLQKFEAGQSCFADATLRCILFSNASEEHQGAEVAHMTVKGEETATPIVKDGTLSKVMTEGEKGDSRTFKEPGISALPLSNKTESLSADIEAKPSGVLTANCSKEKDAVSMSDDSTVGNAIFCGMKAKRSDRDREGKNQEKQINFKSQSDGRSHNSTGNTKGERKTKTKPRQKTAPLFKAMNGLLGVPAELPRDIPLVQNHPEKDPIKDELQSNNALDAHDLSTSGAIDLSHLQIPDDLGIADALGPNQDLNSWFDFDDANPEDGQGELSMMGLAVPMDDLSDLRF